MAGKTHDNIIAIVIAVALVIVLAPIIWSKLREWYVMKSGVTAKAKIVEVTDTGRRHNSNPVVTINLVVTDNAGRDYPASVTTPMSAVAVVKYQPGCIVSVRYDPKNPDRVAIDRSSEPVRPKP